MALAKGIRAQESRFAALSIDSDSGSDGGEERWHEVLGTRKEKCKTSHQQQQPQQENEKRPLSKSAKKRARKKRNQSASSEVGDGPMVWVPHTIPVLGEKEWSGNHNYKSMTAKLISVMLFNSE